MSVVLTEPAELETWMIAPWDNAKALRRVLAAGSLKIVARGGAERLISLGATAPEGRTSLTSFAVADGAALHLVRKVLGQPSALGYP